MTFLCKEMMKTDKRRLKSVVASQGNLIFISNKKTQIKINNKI